MKKRRRLAQLQWQFIRNSLIVSFFAVLFTVVIMTYDDIAGLTMLFDKQIVRLPILVPILLSMIAIGLIAGMMQSLPIKRKLDQILHGVLLYERGTFSHQIESEGEDELAELTDRLNRMAERVEEQVASLQRLSSERAKMQETVKKAAVTEERQRLARDLHDAVSQQLFAISMMTAAIKQNLHEATEEVQQQMDVVEKMANTAQAEMRALLLHLRPAELEGKSLQQGVEYLLHELEQKQGFKITKRLEPMDELPKGVEDQLFRMLQEAISNILRHAQAHHVEVRFWQTERQVRLKLIDDGVGFDVQKETHGSYGLQTMHERINEIGGVLDIVSAPGKGTQLEAKIPITWRGE
ncbi:sensor histidine kinase [Halalkalibacterium halodurans]|uniref:Sensor histidine kinase n=1 Tax=Halalkalibacterium halodurans (strain ATCC BAA-125 / DSM 18197 / FERM 7344 / JCM 9153 / C-125) TaxID=272558 RepID=Q9KDL3_HALH5|nr:sensor histidine kinase [Halalkalibacterium halodurans]MED4173508.1 sensor histidine kinase [Halalkalibacterium halodurans]BAB04918.1 two-component sensor histidine kinase [Halalkalibacterium halodurans C-125]